MKAKALSQVKQTVPLTCICEVQWPFFNCVGTEPLLPGYLTSTMKGGRCILAQGQHSTGIVQTPILSPKSDALSTFNYIWYP